MKNVIKIQFGTYKGKNIRLLSKLNIKPTKSIVKSSFINLIYNKINNSNCLDLFSGTGAIGIELISLGANKVTFVDINSKCCNLIKKNLNLLNVDKNKYEVLNCDCINYVNFNKNNKFDIITIDPPFSYLFKRKILFKSFILLNNNGVLYFEDSKSNIFNLFPENIKNVKVGKNGNVIYYLIFN
ncbi:MAG: 16S rRNA (guanine(966)-N(2))-methyltransferase RsmD [Candidatus Vidania fulgoroideorum]